MLEELERTLRQAGELALTESLNVTAKGKSDFVTSTDLAVDRCLRGALPRLAPGSRVFSEEKADGGDLSGRVFIVDPIDGTTNLMYHMQLSAISCGYAEDGRLMAAGVYNPFTRAMFLAERGRGATLNGAPIHVSDKPLSQGLSLLLNVVQLGLGVGALVAYWKLAVLSGRLRLVWRLQLAGQVVSLAVIGAMLPALFNEEMALPLGGLGLAAALAVAVIALVVQYHFCEGMAEELEQSDPPGVTQGFSSGGGAVLAGSWRLLRRCVFWSLGALAAMVVLALIIGSGLGILLLLGALAAALVLAGCAVAQLVMLWKSAGFFRDLPPLYAPLPPGEENAGL